MLQHVNQHQQRLHHKFIAALDLLDQQEREPDRWEEECLAGALSALACGLHVAAAVELDAFMRPREERSRHAVESLERKPRRFTKAVLRRVLERIVERGPIATIEVLPTADQLEALGRARLFVLEQESRQRPAWHISRDQVAAG
jgi:hypothetical protein